jgi:hypothetical protein
VSDDEQQPYTLCPYCGEKVDPNAPGVSYAVAIDEVITMGSIRTLVDGMVGFFHPGCPPGAVGYSIRPPPGSG